MSRRWCSYAVTDTGQVRKHNEDAVLELSEEQMWCVADGMGGHHEGAYASELTVNTFAGYSASRHRGISIARIDALAARCHTSLLQRAAQSGVDTIGCTLAVLSLHRGTALASSCGDARIYRERNACLLEMTHDHSVGTQSDDRDVQAGLPPLAAARSALTAAIGGGGIQPQLEHALYTLEPTDRFVICTDGLTKEASDQDILNEVMASNTLDVWVDRLFARYQKKGARDNIGLIGVSLHAET